MKDLLKQIQGFDKIASSETNTDDGRLLVQALYNSMQNLVETGLWEIETIYIDEGLPICVLHTKLRGPAVWLFAGIHGEEPAPPNAVALSTREISELPTIGIPVVLFPLCNPVGYIKNWRFPNKKDSVSNSKHCVLKLGTDTPLANKPACPQCAALTHSVLELAPDYQPVISVNLHEDDKLKKCYLYSQGAKGSNDPAAKAILNRMIELKYPIKLSGLTRFGEKIVNGIVSDINDGYVDDLIASQKVFVDGEIKNGPNGQSVIVAETSSINIPIHIRIRLHRAIIGRLLYLFLLSKK